MDRLSVANICDTALKVQDDYVDLNVFAKLSHRFKDEIDFIYQNDQNLKFDMQLLKKIKQSYNTEYNLKTYEKCQNSIIYLISKGYHKKTNNYTKEYCDNYNQYLGDVITCYNTIYFENLKVLKWLFKVKKIQFLNGYLMYAINSRCIHIISWLYETYKPDIRKLRHPVLYFPLCFDNNTLFIEFLISKFNLTKDDINLAINHSSEFKTTIKLENLQYLKDILCKSSFGDKSEGARRNFNL